MMTDSIGTSWTGREVRFGNPAEWQAFAERRPRFLERWERLRAALDATFSRALGDVTRDQLLLLVMGRRCVEDFMEILLLCGNAEGYGAQKLLRSMFEQVVTLTYLHQNRDKIDAYIRYRHVA